MPFHTRWQMYNRNEFQTVPRFDSHVVLERVTDAFHRLELELIWSFYCLPQRVSLAVLYLPCLWNCLRWFQAKDGPALCTMERRMCAVRINHLAQVRSVISMTLCGLPCRLVLFFLEIFSRNLWLWQPSTTSNPHLPYSPFPKIVRLTSAWLVGFCVSFLILPIRAVALWADAGKAWFSRNPLMLALGAFADGKFHGTELRPC